MKGSANTVRSFPRTGKMLMCLFAMVVAFALKIHYRIATAEDLSWILTPTAWLVEILRGQRLQFEAGIGWMPADHGFIIAPVCAGVNFLILLFTASVLGFAGRVSGFKRRCAFLVAMLGCAYVVTLVVNAIRITAAVTLYEWEVHAGWFTAERVHRLAGTVIYLSALSATWLGLERFLGAGGSADGFGSETRRSRPRLAPSTIALPTLAYVGMTVVLPLANGAWRQFGAQYLEHAVTVCLLALATVLLLSILGSATCWTNRRRGTGIPERLGS